MKKSNKIAVLINLGEQEKLLEDSPDTALCANNWDTVGAE